MTYRVECDQGLDDLATGLFRVFAQFVYCLKVTGYCVAGGGDAANPDWMRFARELPPLLAAADPGVAAAISYVLGNPPKKQVYADNVLQWRVVAPQAQNENDLIFLHVRRVRNNLFHRGKFSGCFFDPERSRDIFGAFHR